MDTLHIDAPQKPVFPKKWDILTSTYWWVIHLDPHHPDNNPQLRHMHGHSKKYGFDEARDKRQLLMRIIIRLYVTGWFRKSTKIEWHQRTGEFISKDKYHGDPIIFTTSLKEWTPGEPELLKDYQLVKFFTEFYGCIRDGKDVTHLLPPSRASFSKDDYLDIDKQHSRILNDENRLNTYCAALFNHHHAAGAIVHFFNSYKAKYLR